MKLRSYLRGLGIGIIVTALLLHFTNDNKAFADTVVNNEENITVQELSTQVNAKEDDLGLQTESDLDLSLQDIQEDEVEENLALETEADETLTEDILQDEESKSEETVELTEEADVKTDSSEEVAKLLDTISKTLEDAAGVSEDEVISSGASFTLTIVKGDDSGTVARKLYNAGLVDNAAEFDAYLMQHGYDKRISVGTVIIEEGMTWNEIAQKLSGN